MTARGHRLRGAVLALALTACVGTDASPEDVSSEALDGPITTRAAPKTSATTTAPSADADTAGPWTLTTIDLAKAAGPPRMLVSDGDTVRRIERGVAVRVIDPDGRIGTALGDGTGTIFYEVVRDGAEAEAVGIVRAAPDGTTSELALGPHRSVRLHDLVRIGATTSVLYSLFDDPGGVPDEVTGSLLLHEMPTGKVTRIADASAPSLLLGRASASAELFVLTYATDRTELVEYRGLDGTRLDRPSPTDGLVAGRAPFVSSAVASVDGSETAYLEGPDPRVTDELDDEPIDRADEWQVVIDDGDGEQLRLTVAGRSLAYVTLDFDGRWLLVSGGDADGPVEPLLIDSESPDLPTYLVAGVRGVARLESVAGALNPAIP